MKIAVTGASGFVGSHVLDALGEREGVEVVALSRGAIAPERLPANAVHVAFDIAATSASVYDAVGRPDVLLHLAWGGLPNYLSLHHFDSELPTQYRFLRDMVEGGLPALVATGTCYEYGMIDGEMVEGAEAPAANPYAFAKVALLRQLEFLHAKHPFAFTWGRLFYMYGPRQAPTSIYPLFQEALARGDASFPMSGGEQLRDYLPVEDVGRILAQLALRRCDAGVVNVSSGTPIAIRTLVERWRAEADSSIALDLGRYPYPTYEPHAFWGATARLSAVLATQ